MRRTLRNDKICEKPTKFPTIRFDGNNGHFGFIALANVHKNVIVSIILATFTVTPTLR